jgi:hypothetical protein
MSLNSSILNKKGMNSPLFVIPDKLHDPPRRYLVKDRDENILFITKLDDKNSEETAIKWAMREGGWLAGLLEGGNIPSNIEDKTVVLSFGINKPLYIVLDAYGKRFLVVDDDNNVLFLTDLEDGEPHHTATLAAMQLGGWLKGAVKSMLLEEL